MSNKIKIQLGAILFLVIVVIALLLSQVATPDSPQLYSLKRFQEVKFMGLKSDPKSKLNYMIVLLDTRLDELSKQVNRKSYGYILPSCSRYSTQAGEITDFIIQNNLTSEATFVENQFKEHIKVLKNLYEVYPKDTDNFEYKYIQDDINYLNIYLDKLSSVK